MNKTHRGFNPYWLNFFIWPDTSFRTQRVSKVAEETKYNYWNNGRDRSAQGILVCLSNVGGLWRPFPTVRKTIRKRCGRGTMVRKSSTNNGYTRASHSTPTFYLNQENVASIY